MAGHQSLPPVYKGRVTHVIDPSNFWMRIGSDSNFDNFGLYQRKFDEFLNGGCQEFPDSIGSLELGDCVMVADAEHASGVSSSSDSESEQSHWERAQVFSVDTDSGTVDVFYIDQGFTQIVKFSRVRLANQEIFQCFPPQAHHCELSSIVPLSKAWTRRAVTVFESQVTGRDLVVCVRAAVQPDGYCSVQLFYRWKESGPWLSVASHMLEEEVAMSSGGELEYDELPAQFVEAALLQMEEEPHAVCSDADGTQEAGSDVEVDQQSDHEAGRLSVSETQRCSPHEDVGQPSVNEAEPMSENKRRRPLEAELASSSPPSSSSSPPPSPTEVCSVHSEGREDSRVSEPELGLRKSCDQSVYLPSPSEFMAPPHPGTHSPCDVATESGGIPKVDVKNVFQETSHVDLWQMKEDKVSEAQRHVRSRLELDLHDGSDVEEEGGDSDTEYGPRDSLIGQGVIATGSHDFSEEIFQGYQRQSSAEALQPFLTAVKQSASAETVNEGQTLPLSTKVNRTQSLQNQEVDICRILSSTDTTEPPLVSALVHSVLPPDEDLSQKGLSVVISSLLDSVLGKPGLDVGLALTVLQTYSDVPHFEDELITVLKTLKQRYVRLPQSVRLSETYSLFAFVLARLFNEVEHWQSRCGRSRLEEFSLSTLEGWGVFNKLRVQHQVEELELMYVQCVARFVETSHPKLHLSFPQRYSALLEEVRQKLLHNLTSRTLRTHLLELLLQVHNQGVPLMSHRASGTDVATQTDGQAVNERDRDGHRADSRAAARVAEQTNEMATRGSVGFYRPPRGSLNPRADPFVPHVFPSEIEEGDSAQLLSPPDGAEYSGEVPVLPLDNVKSIVGHGGSHTCTALRDVDGAELENCLESSKTNNLPPLKESSSVGKIHHSSHHAIDRRRKFPKSLLQLPPRLLQKCMTDSHLFLKGAGTHNSHAANTSSGHAADFDNNGHAADRDSDRAVSGDSGRAAHSGSKVVHFRQREAETGSKSFSPPQELDFSNTAESEEMTTGQTNGGCSLARTEDGYRCLELQSGVGQCGDGSESRLDSALLYHHNRKNSFDGKGNERDSSEDQEHLLDQSKDYHVLIRPDGDFTYSVSGNSDLKHDKFDSTSDPEHTLEAAGHVGPLDEVMGSDCTAAPIRGLSERVVQHPTLPSSGGEVDECSRGMLPGTLTIGETGQVSRSQYGLSYSGDSWPVSDDDQLELNRDQVKSGDGQVRTFDSGSRKNDCETKGDFNQLGPDNGPARKELAVRNSQTVCKDQAGQNSKEGVQESLRGRELCKKMHLAYTPDELRALNPFSGDGMGQARVLNEFRDRWMTFLKGLPNAHELPIREPPGWVSKASKPTARYGCSGEAPVALSTVLGSDWMNWKKLSDLLPESKLGQQKVSAPSVLPTVGSSVDPAPYSSSLHANRSYATVQSQSDDSFDFHLGNSPHSDHKSSSLLDRGKSPHSDHKNSPLLDRGNSPHSDHRSSSLLDRGKNPHSDHKNSPLLDRVSSPLLDRGNNPHSDLENNPHSEGNNCATKLQSPTEVWHQPMWPQDFFSSTKTATAPISNPANGDRKNLTSTRSKKKKTKFRPLSDFEVRVVKDEVEHSEPVGRPVREGGDPYGFDDDDDCEGDEDEFSEEMLQMYIQLEEAEQKKDSGQVLHLPRLGGTCDGPPRTSLFAKLRQQEQEREQRAREPWAPGKRFCSKCGGEGHMMYDCPQWNQVTST